MAKEVAAQIKLQAPGGQATPAPPIGPALGQHGVNIGQFVSQFNERTKDLNGTTVPVVITTHRTQERNMTAALAELSKLDIISGKPVRIRIVDIPEDKDA